MSKRLLFLSVLSIFAIVLNHAAGWGFTAMFWWTHRYQPVTVPNYSQYGTLTFYSLLLVKRLTFFSVPALLFVSGFFVAFTVRGEQGSKSWKWMKSRLVNLLVPYVFWSIMIFVGDFLEGTTYTPTTYLRKLAFGGAAPLYYYVPLIFQFYLLAPIITHLARTRTRELLISSASLHLSLMSLWYLDLFGTKVRDQIMFIGNGFLFPKSLFFFALGVVFGLNTQKLSQELIRVKWVLLAALAFFGILSVIEPEVLYHSFGYESWRGDALLSSSLYATTFILCFLAFDQTSVPLPFLRTFSRLGSKIYGIYLLHAQVLELTARVIYHIAPWVLARQILFQPLLITLAVGSPLLFMTIVAKSPARGVYRYLFG